MLELNCLVISVRNARMRRLPKSRFWLYRVCSAMAVKLLRSLPKRFYIFQLILEHTEIESRSHFAFNQVVFKLIFQLHTAPPIPIRLVIWFTRVIFERRRHSSVKKLLVVNLTDQFGRTQINTFLIGVLWHLDKGVVYRSLTFVPHLWRPLSPRWPAPGNGDWKYTFSVLILDRRCLTSTGLFFGGA